MRKLNLKRMTRKKKRRNNIKNNNNNKNTANVMNIRHRWLENISAFYFVILFLCFVLHLLLRFSFTLILAVNCTSHKRRTRVRYSNVLISSYSCFTTETRNDGTFSHAFFVQSLCFLIHLTVNWTHFTIFRFFSIIFIRKSASPSSFFIHPWKSFVYRFASSIIVSFSVSCFFIRWMFFFFWSEESK